jgi:hypothetical protein
MRLGRLGSSEPRYWLDTTAALGIEGRSLKREPAGQLLHDSFNSHTYRKVTVRTLKVANGRFGLKAAASVAGDGEEKF